MPLPIASLHFEFATAAPRHWSMQALDKIGATDPVEVVKELTYAMRPQDPHADGTGLRFEAGEHGGDFPDNMPQAITLTDAQGMGRVRSATGGR